MDEKKEIQAMLELTFRPGFCVRENRVVYINAAASSLPLTVGDDIREYLGDCREEYEAFGGGCLYLALALPLGPVGASVTRVENTDIFLVDAAGDPALSALALAARELREPLSAMMAAAGQLSKYTEAGGEVPAGQLSRGLHQMLRILGNMSDAEGCRSPRMELRDVGDIFREILEKAQALLESAGTPLHYTLPCEALETMADRDLLERAVLNILSNAARFSPKGSPVCATLTRRGKLLLLCVEDSGEGIPDEVLGNAFSRYLRPAGIEDGRYGLGLGLGIVRSAAISHGGTVLIDRGKSGGTRITMTMRLRKAADGTLHSPILLPDYTGGWDHALVELSDLLPASLYAEEL